MTAKHWAIVAMLLEVVLSSLESMVIKNTRDSHQSALEQLIDIETSMQSIRTDMYKDFIPTEDFTRELDNLRDRINRLENRSYANERR